MEKTFIIHFKNKLTIEISLKQFNQLYLGIIEKADFYLINTKELEPEILVNINEIVYIIELIIDKENSKCNITRYNVNT